jgi:hypothetical protein
VPPRLYEISMNDNGKACECEACKAEYEKWGKSGQYQGIWYMSRDYIALNTTYLFLNRHALSKELREAIKTSDFN